jgi:hypothetical protein
VAEFLRAEMAAYGGMVDHSGRLERLAALGSAPAEPMLPVFAERARLNGAAPEAPPAPESSPSLDLAAPPAVAGAELES